MKNENDHNGFFGHTDDHRGFIYDDPVSVNHFELYEKSGNSLVFGNSWLRV